MTALLTIDLSLPNKRSGKVRDLYDCPLPDGSTGILMIATDRVSAFDLVLQNGIPGKGVLLTQMARFWFEQFKSVMPHHLVTTSTDEIDVLSSAEKKQLSGRVMLCKRYEVIPIECIARGYLAGSGLQEYQKQGTVCAIPLPAGLTNASRLPEPIFTPSTKAQTGHDENISYEQACDLIGAEKAAYLKKQTLKLYQKAHAMARDCGIILADTKLEFGQAKDGEIVLIDEIFTPDSSRFWAAESYEPGREQQSFDKQPVRDYLQSLVDQGQWQKTAPAPALPSAVIDSSLQRYRKAFSLLTGEKPPA